MTGEALGGGVALVTEDYSASGSRTGTTTKYLLRDHLGSVSTLVDALGAMAQGLSYDPWGQRRGNLFILSPLLKEAESGSSTL